MTVRYGPSNWGNTVQVVGDFHAGTSDAPTAAAAGQGIQMFRANKMLADVRKLITRWGKPLATLQVGDLCNGLATTEFPRATAFWDQWPIKWASIPGNHDLSNTSATPSSAAFASSWAPHFTLPAAPITSTNYSVDLGPFRAVFADWQMDQAGMLTAHTAQLDANNTKPVVVVIHKPMPDTTTGSSNRWGTEASSFIAEGATELTSTVRGVPNHGSYLIPGYAALKAAWASRAHVKAVVCGHLHPHATNPGLFMQLGVGSGKVVAHLNAGSPYYQGWYILGTRPASGAAGMGSHGPWADPILSYFLEMTKPDGTEWTTYIRDHGNGVWLGGYLAVRARKVTVT